MTCEFELGIVAQFRDEAPYLDEWIRYHQIAGVEHFWLYDDRSTDDWRPALSRHISSGVAEVHPIPEDHDPTAPSSTKQRATFRDGIQRASGRARWIALIDVDEFLLPMRESTVPECLERNFPGAAGIYANWRMFGTSHKTIPPGQPLLPELTACSLPDHPENGIGKSLVRPDRVAIRDLWYTHHFPLLGDARYFDGGRAELKFGERHQRSDLMTTGRHHGEYLRINHYNLRDEAFFRRRRLRRALEGDLPGKSFHRLLEHYESFGMTRDRAILDFLERHHLESYEKIWRPATWPRS